MCSKIWGNGWQWLFFLIWLFLRAEDWNNTNAHQDMTGFVNYIASSQWVSMWLWKSMKASLYIAMQ